MEKIYKKSYFKQKIKLQSNIVFEVKKIKFKLILQLPFKSFLIFVSHITAKEYI